jgi:hypothetical protein
MLGADMGIVEFPGGDRVLANLRDNPTLRLL